MENKEDQDNQPIPPVHLPSEDQSAPQRKPISPFKKFLIVIFVIVSGFGVYDIFFPSQPPQQIPAEQTQQQSSPSTISPTVQQNAGWKTYTNTKHKFAIDYPPNFAYREFPDTKDGAGFRLANTPNNLCCEIITVDYTPKIGNYKDLPFENYVTVAGTGIQNFQQLATSKKITTASGIVGYVTTWQVTPLIGGNPATSDPLTFFPAKDDKNGVIMISIEDEGKSNQLDAYNKMISTFRYSN